MSGVEIVLTVGAILAALPVAAYYVAKSAAYGFYRGRQLFHRDCFTQFQGELHGDSERKA